MNGCGNPGVRRRHASCCIGYSDQRLEIIVARGLHPAGEQKPDHGDLLEVTEPPPVAAKAAVWNRRTTNAGRPLRGSGWTSPDRNVPIAAVDRRKWGKLIFRIEARGCERPIAAARPPHMLSSVFRR